MPKLYKLRASHEMADFIRKLHPDIKNRIRSAFEVLVQDPFSEKALNDELKGLYSYRIKRFRIIYKVSKGKIIDIVAIGPRKYIYEETFRIIDKENKDKI